jgi:hypothetical protein
VAELRATRVRPGWWPHFSSTLRSTAVTARLGRVLGIAIALCFGTGLISELQYHPLAWLPWPAAPVSIYRVTQGVHVLTGTACIPLVLVKLWSVYPNLWRFPPLRSVRHALERGSVALLVAATLVQLVTGYFNALDWYPFRWYFVTTHHYLAYVVMGSVLLHVAVKLPDIVYGLRADVARADVLSEVPWDENPESHSIAGDRPAPVTPGVSRRGVLVATGVGIGAVVVTAAGQSLTPLEPVGLLAIRQWNRGPQDVPVNRTAEQAEVVDLANAAGWVLPRRPRAGGDARGQVPDQLRRGLERRGGLAGDQPAGPRAPGRGRRGLLGPGLLVRAGGGVQPVGDHRPAARRRAAGDPPQRAAARPRPRLPAAADRAQPGRRAEHQVALARGGLVSQVGS